MNYYNEIDPFAAEWLRNLIKAGHIAPGDVDTRSIEDVTPDDLRGYVQCHFFAGIGVWSYALRRAGWPDDRPVWTGSCPCQPFSAAGKGAGFDDERHLWPALYHLISQCRPPVVFGEQVASKDGLGWLDLVQADLEASKYAFGAADLCAAGIGAPHIRQRLYWVADANIVQSKQPAREWARPNEAQSGWSSSELAGCSDFIGLADAQHHDRRADESGRGQDWRTADGRGGAVVRLDNNNNTGLEGLRSGHQAQIGHGPGAAGSVAEAGELGRLADTDSEQQRQAGQRSLGHEHEARGRDESAAAASGLFRDLRPSPTNGHWRDADWLYCRDGKWRSVEPGTFPLAHGASARVGRLRAYGNAIVPQVAETFIRAYLEC